MNSDIDIDSEIDILETLPPIQFYVKSNGPKMLFDFSIREQLSSPKFTKNSKFRVSKIAKNDIFEPFDFPKTWFHVKSEWQ